MDDQNDYFYLSDKTVKIIYHISDIHIRLDTSRKQEYESVFNNLCEKIKEDQDKSLIVVTGDIVHSKTSLKPECIIMVKKFFTGLSNITDVIVILGSHDCNINNKNSMDSLTPIITKKFESKNKIYLLKERGAYEYGNILFGLTTLYDKKVYNISSNKKNKIKIGLYHGQIDNSYINHDCKVTDAMFNVSDFSDYDYVLLGDIHKHQYLNKERTIAYASSLIQQDFSEDLCGHGMIKWNIEKGKSKFIEIENDYGYVTVDIEKENIKKISYVPKNPSFKILYGGEITRNELLEKERYLRSKYEVKDIVHIRDIPNINIDLELKGNNNKNISEINNSQSVLDIIVNYIDSNKLAVDDTRTNIIDKLKDVIDNLNYTYDAKNKKIRFNNIEFNNIFSFGEGNTINFTNFNKIIGLFAPNHSGKSSIIDTILYGIYGSYSRGGKYDCINVNEKNCDVKISLALNDIPYEIYRLAEKNSKGKNTAELVLKKDGKNITKDTKTETEDFIDTFFGDYDDLLNTNIILQGDTGFAQMSDRQRKDVIYKVLKLDIFKAIIKELNSRNTKIKYLLTEKYNEIVNYDNDYNVNKSQELHDKLSNLNITINDLNIKLDDIKTNYDKIKIKLNKKSSLNDPHYVLKLEKNMHDIKTQIDNMNSINLELSKKIDNSTIQDLECKEKNINDQVQKNLILIDGLMSKIKHINKKNIDIEHVKNDIIELENNKENILSDVIILQNELDELLVYINEVDRSQFDSVIEKHKIYLNALEDKKKIKDKLAHINEELTELKSKAKIYENYEYNPDCKVCMKNSMTVDKLHYEKLISGCTTDIDLLNNKLSSVKIIIDDYIENYQVEYDNYNVYIESSERIDEIRKNIPNLRNEMQAIENQIRENHDLVDLFETNKKIVEDNEKHKKEIDMIRHTNLAFNRELDDIKRKIKYAYELDISNVTLKNNKEKLCELESELKTINETYGSDLFSKICKYEKNMIDLTDEKEKLQKQINKIEKEIAVIDVKISDFDKLDKYVKEKEDLKQIYEKILKIVSKGGLIDDIMEKTVIPKLEENMNKILSFTDNFMIKMTYDKNSIKLYKKVDDNLININLISGYEKFIIGVVFRLALIQINKIVSYDFIIIDEGFSCCDDENIIKLKSLYEYIRSHFKWCLIISHLEKMKDYFDKIINIDVINGRSFIKE